MKKCILIVDDDSTILESISIILRESGYNVSMLPNGNMFKKTIGQVKPDLVILDYLMPGKNGDELVKELRAMVDYHTLPVLVLAASQQYKKNSLEAGADKYMTKPFDMYELLDEVKRLLDKHEKLSALQHSG